MNTIKCLVVDDEPFALQQLASYVSKVPFLKLVDQCLSADAARKVIDSENVDAMFVDINMPDLNGLDFVRSLAAPPLVVFTTAYSEHAIDGFRLDAVDYLLKPFGMDEFNHAALKLKRQFELERRVSVQNLLDDTIFFKTEHKVVKVHMHDIRYVEGMSEYLKIYVEGQRPIVVLLSMKRIEERLPAVKFMRIHRSYIVNLQKIQEVNKNRVILDNDTFLPIGDSYRDKFVGYLNAKVLGWKRMMYKAQWLLKTFSLDRSRKLKRMRDNPPFLPNSQ